MELKIRFVVVRSPAENVILHLFELSKPLILCSTCKKDYTSGTKRAGDNQIQGRFYRAATTFYMFTFRGGITHAIFVALLGFVEFLCCLERFCVSNTVFAVFLLFVNILDNSQQKLMTVLRFDASVTYIV